MASMKWNGPAVKKAIFDEEARRVKAACVYLAGQIKADISQSGTLRYNPTTKKGTPSKSQKTIYNVTHSRPGNPPFKQTGNYRRQMTWEVDGLTGRVGTNAPQGRALELGTPHMAARPHIVPNLVKHTGTITQILTGAMRPGGLPGVTSNQFRSGHLGAGAAEAGYD